MVKKYKLTAAAGGPVPDNQNAMTAGPHGPMLMQDVWYMQKLAYFVREGMLTFTNNQASCSV